MVLIELAIIALITQVKKIPVVKRWNDWRTLTPKGLEANLAIGLEVEQW